MSLTVSPPLTVTFASGQLTLLEKLASVSGSKKNLGV